MQWLVRGASHQKKCSVHGAFNVSFIYFSQARSIYSAQILLSKKLFVRPHEAIEKMVCLLILYLPYFRRVQINWFYWLHNPKIELFLSMLVIPLVINIFIFWMTDNFLMMEDKTKYKVLIQGKLLDRYLSLCVFGRKSVEFTIQNYL